MPNLPEKTLLELMQPLKQLNDSLSIAENPTKIDMQPVLHVLEKVDKKESLLNDFLNTSGYECRKGIE